MRSCRRHFRAVNSAVGCGAELEASGQTMMRPLYWAVMRPVTHSHRNPAVGRSVEMKPRPSRAAGLGAPVGAPCCSTSLHPPTGPAGPWLPLGPPAPTPVHLLQGSRWLEVPRSCLATAGAFFMWHCWRLLLLETPWGPARPHPLRRASFFPSLAAGCLGGWAGGLSPAVLLSWLAPG